jgi:ComF family protein
MLFQALSGISRLARTIAAQVPSQCAVCRSWPSQRVCDACVARFAQPAARCQRCALHVPPDVRVCGSCLRNPPLFDACIAAVDYAYPWAGAIAQFKFQGDPGWAPALAALMRSTPWAEPALESANCVLPVPLSTERLRERGFNQAALLAQELAPGRTDAGTLLRVHATEAQSGLPRAQRLRNLRDAFAVEPARAAGVRGQRLVLVDDVMTTGATLHAATQVLRESGAAHVTALVLARTPAT